MTRPFLSIITVTLNNINGLKKTADSIAQQIAHNYEWIVIDGGSDDGSIAYVKNHTLRPADITSETDNGIYDAMNKGIEKARGTYVIFMNAGDMFGAADTCALIEKHGRDADILPDFIYGDSYENTQAQHQHKPARAHSHIKCGMFTHHQAMIYKRQSIGTMRYNIDYTIASDYDFTARFLKRCSSVTYIDKPLCVFEAGGISQTQAQLGRIEQFKIRKHNALICLPINMAYYAGQTVRWHIRKHFPKLYWLKLHRKAQKVFKSLETSNYPDSKTE